MYMFRSTDETERERNGMRFCSEEEQEEEEKLRVNYLIKYFSRCWNV